MQKLIRILSLLLGLWLIPLVSHAETRTTYLDAVQVATGSAIDTPPVMAIAPDGQVVIAWAEQSPEDNDIALLRVARSPLWVAETIARLPHGVEPLHLQMRTLSSGHLRVAWSQPQTSTLTLYAQTLGEPSSAVETPITSLGMTTFSLDDSGGLHYMQTDGLHTTYGNEQTAITNTLKLADSDRIPKVALDVGGSGQAELAWSVLDETRGTSSIFYSPVATETTPTRLAGGEDPDVLVGPEGNVHLSWRADDALYYASSHDWSRLHVIGTQLEPGAPYALTVGPDGVAHAFWIDEDTLWYATSLDWRLSRTQVITPITASSLDASTDAKGRVHLIWTTPDSEGFNGIYYLDPRPASPQLTVTFPQTNMTVDATAVAQAQSNLLPAELSQVAFSLEVAHRLDTSQSYGLLALGVDENGEDGWQMPLTQASLSAMDRYRVVVTATDHAGRTMQGIGGWFYARQQGSHALFFAAEGPEPIRQWTSLSLIGQAQAGAAAYIQLFMLPAECQSTADLSSPSISLLEKAEYVGAFALRPDDQGMIRQSLTYDSRILPDGCYIPLGIIEEEGPRYVFGNGDHPLRVENATEPTVQILTPEAGDVVAEELEIIVEAQDTDGYVNRVEFYLQRAAAPLPAQRIWLGSDEDGSDGWRLGVQIHQSLDGQDWQLVASAIDDQGLTSAPAIVGPLILVGRPRPALSILRPSGGRVLYGTEPVRIIALQGSSYIEGIDLYAQMLGGSLEMLGAMTRAGDAWQSSWDTRAMPDGVYTLHALARSQDGRVSLVSSSTVQVANDRPLAGIQRPQEGEVLSGWSMVQVHAGGGSVSITGLRIYCRDHEGELYWLGDDLDSDNGWGVTWNTRQVVDGEYEIIVEVEGNPGQKQVIRRSVTVRNDTPRLQPGSLMLPERVSGVQTISWSVLSASKDDLTTSLEFSPDDGVHWLPIADGLGAEEAFPWDTTAMPDSSLGRVRLIADSAGYVSCTMSSPFVLDNANDPPYMALLSPQTDDVHAREIEITWRAWDPDGEPVHIDLEYRRGGEEWRPLATDLDNTGRYTWVIGDLPEANDYALRAIAHDPDGVVGSDAIRGIRLASNLPPDVTVLWPTEYTAVTNEAILLWRAIDPDGDPLTIDLWYSDDAGQTWLPLAEGLPNTGYYVWQVSFLPLGTQYRVRVIARDRYFQTIADSSTTFAVGRHPPPSLRLVQPRSADTVNGLQLIRWVTLSPDGSEVQIVPMLRSTGARTWEPLADPLPDDGVYLWDTTRFPDGDYELRLVGRQDDAMRAATQPTAVTISNGSANPPQVTLVSPRGGERWAGIHAITWEVRGSGGGPMTTTIEYSADHGQTWQEIARLDDQSGIYMWDTRTARPADCYLLAITVEEGGHRSRAQSIGAFGLRNGRAHPPHLDLLSPTSAGWAGRDNLISWLAEDVDGDRLLVRVALTRDGGLTWTSLVQDISNAGEFLLSDPLASIPGQRLRVQASDGAQWAVADSGPLPIDTADQAQLRFLAPRVGDTWSGEQVIRWQVPMVDWQDALRVLELSEDGGQTWSTLDRGSLPPPFRWDTTQVANGTYILRLTLQKGDRVTAVVSEPFDIRNAGRNAPLISISEPRSGAVWSGTRTIRWRASDPDGEPLSVNLAYSLDRGISWRQIGHASLDTGSYVWDTSTAPNCDQVWVRAMASDGRFFSWAIATGPIAIRNSHAPAVHLVSPQGGETWTGAGEVRWETAYEGTRPLLTSLHRSLDGGRTWQTLENELPPSGIYLWDSTSVPNESRVLFRVLVSDGIEGGVDVLWQSVTVHNQPTSAPPPFYLH